MWVCFVLCAATNELVSDDNFEGGAVVDLGGADERIAMARKATCDFITGSFPECVRGNDAAKPDAKLATVKKDLEEMTTKEKAAKQEGKNDAAKPDADLVTVKKELEEMTTKEQAAKQEGKGNGNKAADKKEFPGCKALKEKQTLEKQNSTQSFESACGMMPVSCQDNRIHCLLPPEEWDMTPGDFQKGCGGQSRGGGKEEDLDLLPELCARIPKIHLKKECNTGVIPPWAKKKLHERCAKMPEHLRRECARKTRIKDTCPKTCGVFRSTPNTFMESCIHRNTTLLGCTLNQMEEDKDAGPYHPLWDRWKSQMGAVKDMNEGDQVHKVIDGFESCKITLKSKIAEQPQEDNKACTDWAKNSNYCGTFEASGKKDVISTADCGKASVSLETTTCVCTDVPKGFPPKAPMSGPNQNCMDSEGNVLPYFKMQIPKQTKGELPSSDQSTFKPEDQLNACVLHKMVHLQNEAEMVNAAKVMNLMTNAMTCGIGSGGGNGEELEEDMALFQGRRLLARAGGRRGAAVMAGGVAAGGAATFSGGRGNRAGNDEAMLGETVSIGGRRGAVFQSQSFMLSGRAGRGNRAGNDEM